MFSLYSQQLPMLKGEWENHKPLSKAKEGEESFGCLQEGPQQSTGTK